MSPLVARALLSSSILFSLSVYGDTPIGIIGGGAAQENPVPAYAALVAPSGELTQLSGGGFPSTSGYIISVAINNAGMGIIGGGQYWQRASLCSACSPKWNANAAIRWKFSFCKWVY